MSVMQFFLLRKGYIKQKRLKLSDKTIEYGILLQIATAYEKETEIERVCVSL